MTDKVTKGRLGDVEFQFNPITTESASVNYSTPSIKNRETELLDFKSGTGASQDLRIKLDDNYAQSPGYTEDAIGKLDSYRRKAENDAPPVVMYQFGSAVYWCVVTKIEKLAEIRNGSGQIVQAELVIGIREFVSEEFHRTRREQKGRQYLLVSQGDNATFRSIAEQVYGNANLWKAIADTNPNVLIRMMGPIIPAGSRIEIPPWAIAKTYLNTPQIGLVAYD